MSGEFELRMFYPNDIDDEDLVIEDWSDDDDENAFHTIEQFEEWEREWQSEDSSEHPEEKT